MRSDCQAASLVRLIHLRLMQLRLLDLELNSPIDSYPDFLSTTEADWQCAESQKLDWQQNQIRMVGKPMPAPLLETSYGNLGCQNGQDLLA